MAIIAVGSNFSSFSILNNAGGLAKAIKLKHTEKKVTKNILSVASTSGLYTTGFNVSGRHGRRNFRG